LNKKNCAIEKDKWRVTKVASSMSIIFSTIIISYMSTCLCICGMRGIYMIIFFKVIEWEQHIQIPIPNQSLIHYHQVFDWFDFHLEVTMAYHMWTQNKSQLIHVSKHRCGILKITCAFSSSYHCLDSFPCLVLSPCLQGRGAMQLPLPSP